MTIEALLTSEAAAIAHRMGIDVDERDVVKTLAMRDGGLAALSCLTTDARTAALREVLMLHMGTAITMRVEAAADLTYRLQHDGYLPIWTVYDHPIDYPDGFIARLHITGRDLDGPTCNVLIATTLADLRAKIPPGLACFARDESDDAKIVETWL